MKKISFVGVTVFALLVFVGWHHGREAAVGRVENQIRGFGPQIAVKLAPSATFVAGGETIPGQATSLKGFRGHAALPPAPGGMQPVEQRAWEAMAQRESAERGLSPFFAERYSEGTLVRGQGMEILLKPLGSRSAEARIENGKVVSRGAYASTDSLQVVTAGGSEEFLLLHDARAPKRFEYEIAASTGVTGVTLKNGAIHFKGAGDQELQLETPWLVDARGKRLDKSIRWERGATPTRLALVVSEETPLSYPVLIDPSWATTLGQLHTARIYHTATLLQNGKVLVAGGSNTASSAFYASAELFDPVTGAWTVTGSLSTPRAASTATLLANGKVLITGGFNGSTYLASAELYDPASGTWSATGAMTAGRVSHTATLFANGQVLVAGGSNGSAKLKSAEVYNPSTGVWTATGNLLAARDIHTANLLPSGQVLVAGGNDVTFNPTSNSELYTPSTGKWTATGSLGVPRAGHTATTLNSGQVLVVGGAAQGSPAVTQLYNPGSGTWANTGDLVDSNLLPSAFTATLLPKGQVLVVNGTVSQVYNPTTGTWAAGTGLTVPRLFQTSTLMANGLVLVAGGTDGANDIAATELYDSNQGSFTLTGSLATARISFTATLLASGKVLVAGGYNGNDLSTAELYDPTSATWVATGNLTRARSEHTATLLPNGQVLVSGGRLQNATDITASTELYNPANGKWTASGSMTVPRANQTAVLLASGKVLVAGGQNLANGGTELASAELYNPSTGTWAASGSMGQQRIGHAMALLDNGKVLVAGGEHLGATLGNSELYNPTTGVWAFTGNMALGAERATATLLPNKQVLVTGGQNNNIGALKDCQLYDPATGTWAATGSLAAAREFHTATLLASGQVLAAGGYDGTILSSAEIYTPATGKWENTAVLNTARALHTATLLPSGKVLIAAGYNAIIYYPSAELFDGGIPQPASKLAQTINFPAVGVSTYGQKRLLLATATSGLPVVYKLIAGPATVGGGMVTFTGVGTVTVQAGQSGNANYKPAPHVTINITVRQAEQTMSALPVIATQAFPSAAITVPLPVATSGLPVTLSVKSGPATVSGNKVTLTGTGAVTLAANQPGDANYKAAPAVTTGFAVKKAQTVTLTAPSSATFGGPPIAVSATATSGLKATFSIVSGPATISGSTITLTGAGTVVVQASQAGNSVYAAASAAKSITVAKSAQTIIFPAIPNQAVGATVQLQATASSGLPVTYSVSGPATLTGSTVKVTGTGTVNISARQLGNGDYNAATPVSQRFTAQ